MRSLWNGQASCTSRRKLTSNSAYEATQVPSDNPDQSSSPHKIGGLSAKALIRRDRAEWVLLLFLVAIFVWRGLAPAWRSLSTDFPNYYLMARLYRQGYPLDRQYELTWFQRQKDHAGIKQPLVSAIPLTPLSALPILPFSSLSPLLAKRLWLLVTLVLLLATGLLLHRMTALGGRRIAILIFLAIEPLRQEFLTGQLHILILFLLTLAGYLYFKGYLARSGSILALAGGFKIYPFLFVIYFAWKRLWRAAGAMLASCLALCVASVWIFGVPTVRVYVFHVLPRAIAGESNDPYSVAWNSFTALWRRLLIFEPELNPHPLIHSLAAYVVLQPICQALLLVPFLWLVRRGRTGGYKEKLEWGGFVALLLLLSTNPASYQYCALILTATLAVDALRSAGRRRLAVLVIVFYFSFCAWPTRFVPGNPSGWHTLLAFPSLYVMTALWGVLLWSLWKPGGQWTDPGLRSGQRVIFAGIFLGLVGLGIVSNIRNLKGQFANYAVRLFSRPGATMARDPVIGAHRISFTVLGAKGYSLGFSEGRTVSYLRTGIDMFHPATLFNSSYIWAELASTKSQIFRLSETALAHSGSLGSSEIEDGEQPTISRDGRVLAFIREEAGRGSLWVKKLEQGGPASSRNASDEELAGSSYNVCDLAFFPDGRIAFAAEPHGIPALFVTDAVSRRVTPFLYPERWVRYPAISPDGRWLAYSKLEAGNWHIWVRPIEEDASHRLTAGACNSVTPAWLPDSKTLIYATDCGRGLGLTALCITRAVP